MEKVKKQKVIVAMSGGVDSSVTAALLKKQGYEVVGVFFHFWKEPGVGGGFRENLCCSIESQENARKVCAFLEIPFYTVNLSKEFKKEIVDYYLAELKKGRTPNPCVMCNQRIKFHFLIQKALEMEVNFVATGHYAQIRKEGDYYHLYQPKDLNKDQTYFLYRLNQNQLAKIIFPLGEFEKPEIKKIAEEMRLPVDYKEKKESQGVCFISDECPSDFVARHIEEKEGNIIDMEGKVFGKHQGLARYTIGQRKGMNIGGSGPYYVIKKDAQKNELVVSNDEKDLDRLSIELSDFHWTGKEEKLPISAKAKIRYRQNLSKVRLMREENSFYKLVFEKPQRAVTRGQSAVLYADDGRVIGGGIIED